MPYLSRFVASAVCAGVLLPSATAQCTSDWQAGLPLNGTDGVVYATTMWDPDGSGPQTEVLVLAGWFGLAGGAAANNIATYDPATDSWAALGVGTNATVRALTVLGTGELVAGGEFTEAGGTLVNYIARWDGSSWSGFSAPSGFGVGVGMNAPVLSLTARFNNQLLAGGFFTRATGIYANYLAWWNGTNWLDTGSGGMNDAVWALATLPNGDVVAGGNFTATAGLPLSRIGIWDGLLWTNLGSGVDGRVNCLQVMPNGDIIAGGRFLDAGGTFAQRIARWNGGAWSAVGAGVSSGPLGEVNATTLLPNGDLIVAGFFSGAGSVGSWNVARWDGAMWSGLGNGIGGLFYSQPLRAVAALPSGDIVAAGSFNEDESDGARRIARFDGANWVSLTNGFVGWPTLTLTLPNGDLVVAGGFTSIDNVPVNRIALRSGGAWSPLGNGFDNTVRALVRLPNGDLIAGGWFQFSGTTRVNHVARWDGSAWQPLGTSPLGGGVDDWVDALSVMPGGDLAVGGSFTMAGGINASRIARWNGSSWSSLGGGITGGIAGGVQALATAAGGDLYAAHTFAVAGGQGFARLMRWDGVAWNAINPTVSAPMLSLLALQNGDVLVGGRFSIPAQNGLAVQIARWDGGSWYALGDGLQVTTFAQQRVLGMAELPNGDIVAAGEFDVSGTTPVQNIARWDGAAWSPIDGGLNAPVSNLELTADGRLLASGSFLQAGEQVSVGLAELLPSCPATAVVSGAGCVGAGGLDELAASTLPWIGADYRATATGLPATGFAIEVRGLQTTSLPLGTFLPLAVAGCTALVDPFLLAFHVPTGGRVTTSFPLPNSIALAGQVFHQQVVAIELDAAGTMLAATSSNALTLTIGAL